MVGGRIDGRREIQREGYEILTWEGKDRPSPLQVRALLQVWAAHPSPLWPHQSHCWWMGSSRLWWFAWSSTLHPLALRVPSGSQLGMAAHWMPSPTALPQQLMAPGLAWLSFPCPLRTWQPGRPWSATLDLGLGTTARAHSLYSCQVGTEPGPLWLLPAPFTHPETRIWWQGGQNPGHGGMKGI